MSGTRRRPVAAWRPAVFAAYATRAAGAEPQQNALQPAGVQAAHIGQLWNFTLVVCAIVFAAVLLATLVALMRSRRGDGTAAPNLDSLTRPERRTRRSVIAASIVSVVALCGLIVADVLTDRALSKLPVDNPVRIDMTGQQWWWQVHYPEGRGQAGFTTANELHIPVGRPVIVSLQTGDVIHSFWVPNLHGKKDMLPGIATSIVFRADKPGVYRGQCAEFCGAQHALMAMRVIAESPERYDAWLRHQALPATTSLDTTAQHGRDVFEKSACAGCHTVRGTSANGTLAPDLTHLMSRETLAAGVLANTPANLAAWIRDPHVWKPGVAMPAVPLSDSDLHAVVAWLTTLQ
ncbi:cytochrome c oxidase subunit II [Paraburkholderia sp. SARCC-3016]|uniref:cytochrome c oxidase subunit II n=1 Tax=Paraburkholderia sp. SARCC-3016 TaxID=3058611 RepID=UPI002809962A|nr:cytochrome c oxidase subunit II [Paraburkholderia sp. SARCC-3016]MDQ7978873.1 cytochrome c oxidase subunit II [Paraburkholderia sp. SARCC-3016]